VIKVAVAGAEQEVVLEDEGGDPQVVGGNGRSLAPELAEDRGVVMGRLFVGENDANAGLHQETPQRAFVLGAAFAEREASAQLRQYDEREEDGVGSLDESHYVDDSAAEIGVAVGVEGEPQRQSRRSIRC
jgi:hypothetical protein